MSEAQNRTSPVVVIAAIAVIIFSAVGVGVMTGIIPSSFSKSGDEQVLSKADSPKEAVPPAAPAKKTTSSAPAVHRKAQTADSTKHAASEPVRVASAPRICNNCGRIEAVNAIEQKGEGTGLGAVAGGVLGGVLGHQVGGGTGRTVATVVGVGAGALAGNEVEKRVKKTVHYDVVVRLEDGTSRTFSYQAEPAFRTGDKVKIVEGAIVAD